MKRRSPLLPLLFFAIVFFLLNWYVVGALTVLTQSTFVPTVFWTVNLVSLIALIFALSRMSTKGMGTFFKIATHTFLILSTSELLFACIVLFADVYRLLAAIVYLAKDGQFLILPRNIYWIDGAIVVFLISIAAFVYGMVSGKYAYRVVRHTLVFDDLPSAFDGFTLAQISDIHAGSFTDPVAVQRGIDLVKKQNADLVVFTGDLVNNKADEIKPWMNHFSQIRAPFGQFSILGNHDYGDYVTWANNLEKQANLQQLKKYHQELGFRLLLDEHIELEKDGQKITLLGIENWGLGFGERGDLKKALENTKTADFKILLSHDPSHWEAQVKNNPSKIHLTLAGHTHGMQFGIEAFGIKWSPVQLRYKHWAGIKEENGRILNVNRGFGFLGFSGRVGIWPEITLITLKKG